MNHQYMQQQQHQQQQPGYYTGPHAGGGPPFEALTSNVPENITKGPSGGPQNYQSQKPVSGPPPSGNLQPPINSPYYNNNIHGNTQPGHPPSISPHIAPTPTNQSNLTNQMSNLSVGNPQPRPPSVNFLPHSGNSNSMSASLSNVNAPNGYNTPSDHSPSDSMSQNDSHGPQLAGQLPRQPPPQQGLSSSQQAPSNPPFARHSTDSIPQFPSQQPQQQPQYPGQPPLSGHAAPPQPGMAMPGQQSHQGPPQLGQSNKTVPPSHGVQPPIGYSSPNQQRPGPPHPFMGQQSLAGPPPPGQQNLSGPPPPSAQPPPPGQPSYPGQQNMSGPPLPGQQNLSGAQQPMPGQQHGFSGQQQSLSAPPLPGQQSMAGQGNSSGPPGPGGYHIGGPPPGVNQPGQIGGQQRQYMPGPPPPGQAIGSPMNRQTPGSSPGYPQPGFPQQSYQPDPYAGQRGPYQGAMPGPQAGAYQPGAAPQQARRLDPDQMPSPIQVMQDDQRNRGGVFVTNQKGLVPPLVTTKYTTQDQGNASPRFIRSTMYTVPTTNDMMKQTGVPFGLIISPMAQVGEGEYEPPIVDMGEIGPVRCIRCKSYMSPFMQFIDAGRRFQCMFCKATSEVPQEYFQHLDHTGQRMDRYERPELMLGTYEYTATTDYCRNNVFPKAPAIIFLIDVSYNNVKSGLVNLICAEMKRIIGNLPIDVGQTRTSMKVGFITYNNTVHFYNVNACLTQPQMMVVGDVQDVFMPLLDGFLCDAEESEAVIDSLMTQIPAMFADTRETETILAPAIQAGLEALKASDRPGKLMVFHSSLPIAEAPGKLKNRDDRKVLGTEKEKTVLAPQVNIYNNLGQECVSVGCSVDLFVFNNSYVDVATIGQVCRLTGGEIYKYTYFQADTDGERLITDVVNNISRPIAFDAVMRVRTSTGVRGTDFFGHFYMSNTTDMELASIDCNKAVAIEIKHDDKLTDEEGVYIQAALLYTSCGGIRRLRIINLSLRTSSQMAELYRACDLDAVINFFSKQSVFKLIESSPKSVKDGLIARCATILAAYRKHCASPSSAGQLILPECMKLLPLYVNCLLKSDAISGGADMTIDDRSYVMQAVATMPLYTSVIYFYPRLLPLHDIDPQGTDLPQQLRCSFDKFLDDGAYLLENGIHMFLWLGLGLSSEWVNQVFGVMLVDTDRTTLPVLDTPLNKRIRDIVTQVRAERHHCMRLTIVRQREKLEMVLRHFLVEDRGNDSSPSYVDFLCHMHKEIKTLLSQ